MISLIVWIFIYSHYTNCLDTYQEGITLVNFDDYMRNGKWETSRSQMKNIVSSCECGKQSAWLFNVHLLRITQNWQLKKSIAWFIYQILFKLWFIYIGQNRTFLDLRQRQINFLWNWLKFILNKLYYLRLSLLRTV